MPGTLAGDAWLGVFKSYDGGLSWQSTLLPGYPQDKSPARAWRRLSRPTAPPPTRPCARARTASSTTAASRSTAARTSAPSSSPRYFDANQKENGDATQGKDTIKYVVTVIVDTGTSGQFLDKTWIAVDIPRRGRRHLHVQSRRHAADLRGRQRLHRLEPLHRQPEHQDHVLAIARLREDLVEPDRSSPNRTRSTRARTSRSTRSPARSTSAWRRFATSSQPDAIVVARSTDFGKTFASKNTNTVATIAPFDQGTSGTQFRTNALPSIAVSVDQSGNVSRVHVAWAQRNATSQDARIVMSTSTDGAHVERARSRRRGADHRTTSAAPFARGHQFMPQITFSAGRLMVLYYDQRLDHTLGFRIPNHPFAPDAQGRFYRVRRDPKGELPAQPGAGLHALHIDDVDAPGAPAHHRPARGRGACRAAIRLSLVDRARSTGSA